MKAWTALIWLILMSAFQTSALAAQEPKPFVRGSHQQIVGARAGKPFIVAFWSVNCSYCGAELEMFGRMLKRHPGMDLVLVAADTPLDIPEIRKALDRHGLGRAESWVFADTHVERLRFEIDPEWYGELPRSYFHGAHEWAQAVSGKLKQPDVERWLKRQQH